MLVGCKQEPVPPSNDNQGGEQGEGGGEEVPDGPGIKSAADFIEFAKAVNEGESTAKWQNSEGWVNLLTDIDFKDITEWTPVGNVVAPWDSYNPVISKGQPFTGKFDGNAKRIKNLKLVDAVSTVGEHFGLFGYLGKGAVVQNFIIDESCSLTVTSSVSHSVGMIAGVLYDATVRDVTSYAPMTYKGGASGYFHMALIGGLYANEDGCTVDSVHNYGAVTAENTANLNAGATGLHVAGIVGFANAGNGSNVISSCNNYGSLTSQAGRTAGIVGAANKNTAIKLCENRGDQLNTMPSEGGGRLGNICCMTNNGSSIEGCKNYGKLVSTTAGRVGGIVSLPNAGEYKDNENYGEILSDSDYRGVFFGYVNTAAAWKGGKASGKVGKYNGGEPVYDLYSESQKVKYLGKDGSSGKATFTDVVIDIATGEDAPDPDIEVEAAFRIFFIGNSFTKDAVEHLPKILKAAGLSDIQMVHMYYGGRTVPEYNSGWSSASDYHCYVCNPGQEGWTDLSDKTLAQIASSGKWDVVTIQEHTGRKLAWGWTEDEKNAITGLLDKIKAAQSEKGGNPYYYYILSQAYHNLAKSNDTPKPFSNTDEMWTVISAQGKKAVEECGFDGVISTGAMLQNLRTSGLNNSLGLTRDGYHMDYGIARYGASCTVFETIIGPFNGNVKLDGNTFRTSGDSRVDGSWTTAITDARAPIALKAARYAIAKPYEVTDMEGEGGGDEPVVVPDNISISNAAELTAFAARVNSGDEKAVKATVTLTSDIDCSSLTSWTPIANCSLSSWSGTSSTLSGNSFLGSFDGQNHKIKNLKMNFTPTENNGTWGFFGAIGDGAVVKNIEFDSSCSMSISTGKAGVFGTLAGFVADASVENIKCAATVSGGATSSLADNNASGRVAVGGVVGWVMAGSKDITLSKLHFSGRIGSSEAPFSKGGNSGNGGNGVMLGGVVGVSTTAGSTRLVTLSELVNDGEIHAATGRVSGVCSTLQQYTALKSCTNNGDIYFYTSGAYRPGNITCIAAAGCILEDCLNTGDLIAPDTDSAAGVICLVNNDNVKITRCHSKGAAIVCKGFDLETPSVKYAGLLYGQCNKNGAEFSGCSVNGKVGKTEAGAVAVTADNYFTFVGQANANNTTINTTNITFATE